MIIIDNNIIHETDLLQIMNNEIIIYYKNLLDNTLLKIVKIISQDLRKSREPTYRESFIIIWLEELSDLQLNKSLYMCPTYQEIFKYKKKIKLLPLLLLIQKKFWSAWDQLAI